MDLCNSNPCCSKVNYNLIFNKDQSFGLSGDQPPSEAIFRLHPLSPQEHKLRCDERGLLWITKDTPVSQEMPKILDALCQEPGEKTKYCFYYTTPSDWEKKKKTSEPDKIYEIIVFKILGFNSNKKEWWVQRGRKTHEVSLTIIPLLPVERFQAPIQETRTQMELNNLSKMR